MTDQNEFQSLDKLFKSTFDKLPDMPAASGWDQPSPRVWENVHVAIQPKTGFRWRWQYTAALAGASLITLAAVYFLNQPQQTIEKPFSKPEPAEQTSAAAPSMERNVNAETPAIAGPAEPFVAPAVPQGAGQEAPAIVHNRIEPEGLAEQLPGTKPAPPNTTEQLKAELKHIWTYPLSPLPSLPLKSPVQPKQ